MMTEVVGLHHPCVKDRRSIVVAFWSGKSEPCSQRRLSQSVALSVRVVVSGNVGEAPRVGRKVGVGNVCDYGIFNYVTVLIASTLRHDTRAAESGSTGIEDDWPLHLHLPAICLIALAWR